MITKAELVAVSKKEKIPLGTVEKDYVLTSVLKQIYESEFKESLVFKGGTALHKLYLFKRFSVDLDFTELKKIDTTALKKVIEHQDIKSRIKDIDTIGKSIRITLGYVSALEFANRIFLDISKREQPVIPLVKKTIHSPFFESFDVLTFQLEELLAEKIRALMQRKKPRDYLDIYYIAESGEADFKKAIEIAEEKLSPFKEHVDKRKIEEDTELVQSLWKQDLREILPSIPDFDDVLKKIMDIFNVVG
jgi:predicted nucleotidyltransferase component of viral defense system